MGNYPSNGKKLILSQFVKKNNRQLIKNCRPISLLRFCGKILSKRLICNKMFEFFKENDLISHNQSGFKPRDSCIGQLLCITHDIYQSLGDGLETSAVFFDYISQGFDKV